MPSQMKTSSHSEHQLVQHLHPNRTSIGKNSWVSRSLNTMICFYPPLSNEPRVATAYGSTVVAAGAAMEGLFIVTAESCIFHAGSWYNSREKEAHILKLISLVGLLLSICLGFVSCRFDYQQWRCSSLYHCGTLYESGAVWWSHVCFQFEGGHATSSAQ